MSNQIRDSLAWKERCIHEDKAALSFINSFVLSRDINSSRGPTNVPSGFKPKGLPHLLEPVEKRAPVEVSSRSRVTEDDALSSARSCKSNISSVSQKSTARSSNKSVIVDEESKKKIEVLERSLEEERKGRIEVQQELQNLRQLIKENLKK